MENLNLTKIKYYPDRFYICLDGFSDIQNLTAFLTDLDIKQEHSIFIHEYYHYLTNITTFPGVRQFNLNFCDRFVATTILAHAIGLDAFPLNSNTNQDCQDLIQYWNDALVLFTEDDLDYKLVEETEKSASKRFGITSVVKKIIPMEVKNGDEIIKGSKSQITINIDGLIGIDSFNLTFGAIDEFLSSSIDEYLFQNDLSDINPSMLSNRPFYPYCFFDELLVHYEIRRATAFEKIALAYFSLNSQNPAVTLIDILEKLRDGAYEDFQSDPEKFLLANVEDNPEYNIVLNEIKAFADLCFTQRRFHISQALHYYYDKFFIAQKLKEQDFFFFIRPFFVKENEPLRMKQQFLLKLSRIINVLTPPVILQDKQLWTIDKLTSFGEATALVIATYEVMESIKTNQIAKRPPHLKAKYTFPDREPECDTLEHFTPPPINGIVFRLALNEIGLYGLYLNELQRRNQ